MSPDFDPYFSWLGIPPSEQPADCYRLLGLRRLETDHGVISSAAENQIQVLRSSPYGDRVDLAKKLLVELKAARDCLSDPVQKAQYDQQLAAPTQDHAAHPQLRTRASPQYTPQSVSPVVPVSAVPSSVPDSQVNPMIRRRRKSGLVPIFLFCAAVIAAAGTFYFVNQSENKKTPEGQAVADAQDQTTTTSDTTTTPDILSTDPSTPGVPADGGRPLTGDPEVTAKVPATIPPLQDSPALPTGPVRVTGMELVPIETEGLPEAWQGAQRFNWVKGAGKSPHLEFNVDSDALVYLVVSYAYEGNDSGGWIEERLTREKLVELGWQDLGASAWPVHGKSLLFVRACKSGENYRLRTNKYKPPFLVLAGSEVSLASPAGTVATTPGTSPSAFPGALPETPLEKPVQQVPVPDDDKLAEAEQLVKEVFGEDMAAAQIPEQQAELAEQLLDSALESDDDVAARYVLLGHVRDLAAQSGNRSMIIRAVDTLARFHEVDAIRMKARAYHAASRLPLDVGTHRNLAEGVLALMDEAMNANRFKIAKPLAQVALASAKLVESADLDRRIVAKEQLVLRREASFVVVQQAREALQENPDDPAANLAYGSHLCLLEDDWSRGLPLLAKSGEEKLQVAVALDLAGADKPSGQAAIGEVWFTLASSDNSKAGYLARAHHWFSMALPTLTGLTKANKRLGEIKSLGYVARDSSPPTTFGVTTPELPAEKESEASLEGLTRLERRMVGIFEIVIVDKKSNARDHFSARFYVSGKIAKEGTDLIGTWKLDEGSRIKLTLTPKKQGETFLRSGRAGTFTGLQTTADNESRVWQLKPVTAVAAWKVATVDNTHHKSFVLYSNGKVDNPYSEYTWSLKGASLMINTIHGEAGFTIQPGGQTLKGRWMRGGHFVGVRIKDPSQVKDFEVRNP